MDMIALKYMKDLVNWWLSYLLSQPVEFDMMTVLYFALQYMGMIQLSALVKQAKPYLSVSLARFKKDSLEIIGG